MSDTYVLVHGAWHTGDELEPTARHLRERGHTVFCPTLAGNRVGDERSAFGLQEAARSLVDFIEGRGLREVRLAGHSYGGMVISQALESIADRVHRLVYMNAFVPLDGESLNDMVPPAYTALFDQIAAANQQAVMLPFPIWREVFINDADLALAESAYAKLNLHPYRTFTEPARLSMPLAARPVGKSYLNCQQDVALPASLPWHPRLSERLGLFRLVECPGSHELLFTDPARLAVAIEQAGRD